VVPSVRGHAYRLDVVARHLRQVGASQPAAIQTNGREEVKVAEHNDPSTKSMKTALFFKPFWESNLMLHQLATVAVTVYSRVSRPTVSSKGMIILIS
jgi:hypothetical protein